MFLNVTGGGPAGEVGRTQVMKVRTCTVRPCLGSGRHVRPCLGSGRHGAKLHPKAPKIVKSLKKVFDGSCAKRQDMYSDDYLLDELV